VIIAIDCDGVLADFVGGVLDALGAAHTHEDVVCWDIELALGLKRGALAGIVSRPGWVASLRPIDGARDAVDALRAAGHRVVCVTTPWHTSPHWHRERHAWLEREFAFNSRDIVQCGDKSLINTHVLCEDNTRTANAFASRGDRRRAVLIDAPWNRRDAIVAGVTRVASLAEVAR